MSRTPSSAVAVNWYSPGARLSVLVQRAANRSVPMPGAGEPEPQSWSTAGSSRLTTGEPPGMAFGPLDMFQYCACQFSLGWSGVLSQVSIAIAPPPPWKYSILMEWLPSPRSAS